MPRGNKTHGSCTTLEYKRWIGMKHRCVHDKLYLDGGITVSPEWESSFAAFIRDMGPLPDKSYSIERKNYKLGYCKENCAWADIYTQNNNTSRNRFVTIDGVTRTRAEWGRINSIPYTAINNRVRIGWPEIDAVTVPMYQGRRKKAA